MLININHLDMEDSQTKSTQKMPENYEEKRLFELKIKYARKYQKPYSRMIVWLFILVLIKRFITHNAITIIELCELIGTLGIFILLSKLYTYNNFLTQYVPYLISILSYYSHSDYMFKN